MSVTEQIQAVLQAHPLEAGKDFYAGHIICGGCHHVLGDPVRHLTQVLAEALDPSYEPVASRVEPERLDPRESQIVWERSSEESA